MCAYLIIFLKNNQYNITNSLKNANFIFWYNCCTLITITPLYRCYLFAAPTVKEINVKLKLLIMQFFKYYLLALVLFFATNLFGQDTNIKFKQLNVHDGLSQSRINVIFQDSNGFIWFGTDGGLNRYDGYEFKIFVHIPNDSTSISSNFISDIKEDDNGYLWISTKSGLSKYDHIYNKFTNYFASDRPETQINIFTNIAIDNFNTIWVISQDKLFSFDIINEKFEEIYLNANLSNGVFNTLILDSQDNLWVTHYNKIFKLGTKNKELLNSFSIADYSDKVNNYIPRIAELDTDKLLLFEGKNICLFNEKTLSLEILIRKHSMGGISSIIRVNVNTFWIGAENGVYIFDLNFKKLTKTRTNSNLPNSLSSFSIRSLMQDRDQNIWVGTANAGVNFFNQNRNNIKTFTSYPKKDNLVRFDTIVRSIVGDDNDNLFLGMQKKGINKYKIFNNSFIHDNSLSFLKKSFTHAWTQSFDKYGNLWVGSRENGVFVIDKEGVILNNYRLNEENINSLSDNQTSYIYKDLQGEIWVATRKGFNKYIEETNSFKRFIAIDEINKSSQTDIVNTIIQDKYNNLWIGTEAGLQKMSLNNEAIIHYLNDHDDPKSLSFNFVSTLFVDKQNVLWVGTYGGGLNKYDYSTNSFERYSVGDGLPSDIIFGILEDDHENLWISTNRGITKFDSKNDTFQNYDVNDGLVNNEFNMNAVYKNKNGRMYFGSMFGLNYFHPDSIRNFTSNNIVFTSLKHHNMPLKIGEKLNNQILLTKSILVEKNLQFNSTIKNLTLEFSSLDYIKSKKSQYAYKVEGIDNEWNYLGESRSISMDLIPKGISKLLIRGTNSDGYWNDNYTSIEINKVPPFWQTNWFVSLLGILIFGTAIKGFKLRTKSLTAHNLKLEELVNKRTEELTMKHGELISYKDSLELNEERLNLALSGANLGMWDWDVSTGAVYFNEGLSKILEKGNSPFKENIEFWNNIIHPEDFQRVSKLMRDNIKDNSKYYECEYRIQAMSGEWKWILAKGMVASRNKNGFPKRHTGICFDITDKLNMEEEINKLKRESDLFIRHEISNWITPIKGYSELLKHTYSEGLSDIQYNYVDMIDSQSDQIVNFINKLQDIQSFELGNIELRLLKIDISKIVIRANNNLEHLSKKHNVTVLPLMSDENYIINGDPEMLSGVFYNLIKNAIEHVADKKNQLDKIIKINVFVKDSNVIIQINNKGKPISKENLAFFFEKFNSNKSGGFKGTGLGTTYAYVITKAHGGEIGVASDIKYGTTLTLKFPLYQS